MIIRSHNGQDREIFRGYFFQSIVDIVVNGYGSHILSGEIFDHHQIL